MLVLPRRIRGSLVRLVLPAVLAGLLAGCGAGLPVPPVPAPSPVASPAAFPTETPAARPATAGRVSPATLLVPADLVFDAAYPAQGWRRCDDYGIDRSLENYRRAYKVTSSIAAVWEYGTRCVGNGAPVRIDEYAWVLQNDIAAGELAQGLDRESYVESLPAASRGEIRRFPPGVVWGRAVTRTGSGGQPSYVAEVAGQRGTAAVYFRLVTDKPLSDEQVLALGQLFLSRAEGAQQ